MLGLQRPKLAKLILSLLLLLIFTSIFLSPFLLISKDCTSVGLRYNSAVVPIIFFVYLFLETGGGRYRETKIHVWLPLTRPILGTWPAAQAGALTGNQTSDPLVCRLLLSPLSHTSQGI